MAWIRWTGKALEFTGKLIQTDSFEKWAEDQGAAIVERAGVVTGGYLFGLGRNRRAKSAIWADLEKSTQSTVLKVAIQNTISRYPFLLQKIMESGNSKVPSFHDIYVIPRFLLNDCAQILLNQELGQSEELRKLKGEDALRQFFFEELVRQLDSEFVSAATKASAKYPMKISDGYWIVGFDPDYEWLESRDIGHYYLFWWIFNSRSGTRMDSEATEKARKQLAESQDQLGRLSAEKRDAFMAGLPKPQDVMAPRGY